MQDFKGSKIFACGAFIFNIHIFRFRMHARLQVDIDFNTESKFSFSRSGFFSPLGGHSKVTKPVKLLFYPIGAFRGPRNHPVSIARSFCVNMDKHAAISQNWKNPFVNKQPGVQHEGEFWEEERWLAVWLIGLSTRQNLIKIFTRKLNSFLYFYVNIFYLVLFLDIDILEE